LIDAYNEEAGRYESDEDQQRTNQILTQTFQKLFKIMRFWGNSQIEDLTIILSVKVYSSNDLSRLEQNEARVRRRLIRGLKDILDRRLENSCLCFVEHEKDAGKNYLPDSVPAINELHIDAGIRAIYG
jgi:hypothetical protein